MIGMRMVVDLAPPVAGVDVGDVAAFGHVAAVGKRRRDKPQAKLHSSVSSGGRTDSKFEFEIYVVRLFRILKYTTKAYTFNFRFLFIMFYIFIVC